MTRPALAGLLAAGLLAASAAAQPPASAPPSAEDQGRELFAAGKYDEALAKFQEAGRANPQLPPGRVLIAGLFYRAKQLEPARRNLETALAEDPGHPEALLLNASFALPEGRLTDVILSCQAALAQAADPRWNPDQRKRYTREGRIGLATAFEARRDYAAARDQLAAILKDDPQNGPARARFATTTFQLGNPDGAFAEFQAAAQADPALELPELQMASLYSAKGDAAKAEEWLKKAVAARGDQAKTHRTYAAWLVDAGRLDDAKAELDAAARIDPASKETRSVRGVLLRHQRDYAAAEPLFEALLRDSPGNSFAALSLALTLAESPDKGKLAKAVELAENEVRKNNRNTEALAVLAWCYLKAGRAEEAERLLPVISQAGNLNRDTGYFVARVLADRGRYAEALGVLRSVAAAKGAHLYPAESAALLAEVEKKVPAPAEPEKK